MTRLPWTSVRPPSLPDRPTLQCLAYLKAGVRLCSSPGLHAKVFILGNRAVVGSSNMSKSSQQVLREAVVVLDDPSAVKAAAAAATRLLGPDIGLADLNAAASLYRPPARTPQRPLRPSGKHPAGEPPGPRDRLWVVGLYADEWPVTATNKATAAQRGIRRRAGRAADVEIESALWDLDEAPKLKLDDVVIEAWAPGKHDPLAVAMHPARVIEILNVAGRGRSRGWVIAYWRRPTGTTTRTWSELRHAAARGGVRLTDKRPIARRITKPRAHAELRKLWAKGRVNRASD